MKTPEGKLKDEVKKYLDAEVHKMKTPEGKLKDEVKKYLDSIGAYWFMPVQTGYGRTTLDFLVCYRGRFIGIETKAPRKKPTARQNLVLNYIDEAGGFALVIDSRERIEDLMAVVYALDHVIPK